MKILSLGTELQAQNGGLPEYLRQFASNMGKDNEIVFLSIALKDIGEEYQFREISPGVREVIINRPDFFEYTPSDVWKYTLLAKAFKLTEKFKPDVTICHDWFWIPVLEMQTEPGPVIFLIHFLYSYFNRAMGLNDPLVEACEMQGAIHTSWRNITNSESTLEDLVSIFPQVEVKSLANPLGVDKKEYGPVPNMGSKVILYIGRLQGEKGIPELIRNIRDNAKALKDGGYEVWIAGKGVHLEDVVDAQMEGLVKYLGVVDTQKKKDAIGAAKFMVFPSIYEPWGLALNEGLASGKLCFATPVGGHREQIKDGVNGYFVPDGRFIERILETEKDQKKQTKVAAKAVDEANNIQEHFDALRRMINDTVRSYRPVKK